LRIELQHSVKLHLFPVRAQVEKGVDAEPEDSFILTLWFKCNPDPRQAAFVQGNRGFKTASDALAIRGTEQAVGRKIRDAVGQGGFSALLKDLRDGSIAFGSGVQQIFKVPGDHFLQGTEIGTTRVRGILRQSVNHTDHGGSLIQTRLKSGRAHMDESGA